MQQKSESGWWRRVEGGWEDDGVSLPERVGEEEKTRRQLERGGNQAANGIAEEAGDKGVKLQATLPQVRSTMLCLEPIHLGEQIKGLESKGG